MPRTRHRPRNFRFVPIALAALLALQVFGATQAQANPGDKIASDEPPQTSSVMRKQQPMVDLVTKIQKVTEQGGLVGFAGTEFDHEANKVILYWRGPAPAAIAHIASKASGGVTLEVRNARYSLATLDAEAQRVGTAYRGKIKINRVGPLRDYSGLKVQVDPSVDTSMAEREIDSSVPVVISTAPAMEPTYNRWNDIQPYWGGAAIKSATKACSTGFTVFKNGSRRMATSAHCGTNESWYTFEGGDYVGDMNVWDYTADIGLLSYTSYGPGIYTGDYQSNVGKEVQSSHVVSLNEWVCLSGALSGEVCGNVIQEINVYTDNNTKGPGFWTENVIDKAAMGQGDSGGPVYNYKNTTWGVDATGLISGGSVLKTCEGWKGVGDSRRCFRDAFSVNLYDALRSVDAVLDYA